MIPIKFMSKEIPLDYYSNGNFNAINITWAITRKCSLSCTYCEVCEKWKHYTPTKFDIDNILNYIYSISKNKKYVDFMLFGGEPTVSEFYLYVMEELRKNIPHIHLNIFTNLNATSDEYIYLQEKLNTSIEITYHYGVDPDVFIDKILKLKNREVRIYVMLDPRCVTECFKVFYTLLEKGYYVEFNEIFDSNIKLTKELYSILYRETMFNTRSTQYLRVWYDTGDIKDFNFEQAVHLGMSNFKGWTCTAGPMNIFIECQGDIYPCQVECNEHFDPICNCIKNPVFKFDLTKCRCNDCACEIFIPKFNK